MASSDKNIVITPNIGSSNDPNIVFTGNANVPITLNVSNNNSLLFSASSSNVFSLTTSGNVGVGTGVPANRLSVYGNISIANTTTISGIIFADGTYQSTASSTNAVNAANAANINVTTTSTNATFYPTFVEATSGNIAIRADSDLTFNPSTNQLSLIGNAFIQNSGSFGNLSVTNSTAATNTTTGALTVAGGVGIRGDTFIGGNVGVSTSSTQGYRLYINGTTKITGAIDTDTQFLGQPNDTETTPSFSWTGDTITGFFRPSSNVVAVSTAGSERLRVNSVGNVGIGTQSPVSKVQIWSTTSGLVVGSNGTGFSGYNPAATAAFSVYSPNGGSSANWYDPSNYAGYIFNNSNSPQRYGLLVSDLWRNTENYVFAVDGRFGVDGTLSNDTHNPYFLVRGDGRVGLGTSSPISILDTITSNSNVYSQIASFRTFNDGAYNTHSRAIIAQITPNRMLVEASNQDNTKGTLALQHYGGNVAFGNNNFLYNSNAGTITFSGSFGITNSTAATSTTTGALTVAGGAGVSGNIYVGGTMFGVANNAINTSNLVVTNTSTNATFYPAFVEATSGNLAVRADSDLTYNPATATLSLTGNAWIQNSGSFGNVSITNTTAATNSTTGALTIAGGVGIANGIVAGGNVGIGTTSVVGYTNTALAVYGNIQISNVTGRTSGIRFPDGSILITANAANVGVTNSSLIDQDFYVTFVDSTTGNAGVRADTDFTYNPSTNQIKQVTWAGTAIAANYGGTGRTAYTQGDILFKGTSGTVLETLPIGTVGLPLVSDGSQPKWGALNLANADVTINQLPLNKGGTNASLTASNGGMIYSTATAMAITSTSALVWDNTNGRLGIGVASPNERLDIRGNIYSTGSLWVGNISIANSTASTSTATGALTVAGGVGITGNVYASNAYITSNVGIGTNDLLSSVMRVYANNSTDAVRIRQDGNGNALVVSDSANDTSPFIIDSTGRVGIGTYPPVQLLDVWGNTRITASTWVGNISVTNSTAATSTTTGALTVAGGVGVVGSMYVGGTIFGVANNSVNASNIVVASTSTNATFYPAFVEATSGNLAVRADSDLSYNPNTGQLSLTGNAWVTNSGRFGNLSITNTTTTTSNTTGALTVAGGVGIAGNIFASGSVWAGNISITNSTATTSSTTGALVVSGGVAIGQALTYGGVTLTNSVTGTGSMVLSAGPTFTGTLASANHTITSASANALAVGPNGTTNPAFNVDASTASSATGINIKSAAAGAGIALSVISSGLNENLTIDAKGTGTITLGGTSTGAITLTRATTMSAALTYGGVTLSNSVTGTGSMVLSSGPTITLGNATGLPLTTGVTGTLGLTNGGTGQTTASAAFNALSPITSTGDLIIGNGVNSATRLAIGLNTYVLTSNGTTASWAAVPAAALTVGTSTVSSGTSGYILYNNAGTLGNLANTGTGINVLNTSPTISGLTTTGTLSTANHTITSASANALAVGLNGTTNPAFNVDASTASSATGLNIKSAAAAGGVALSVISSGLNENLTIDAKGTGTITLGGTSTGAITLTRATTMSAALTYGGVTLNNAVTGTGNMVLSASPTLSGTIAGTLTFSGALTLSSALTYGGVTLSNSVTGTGSMVLSAGPTFTGTLSSANHTITSASANALAVGLNGTTNPAFNVDASTASSATGLNIKSAAAAGGVALSVISSGLNENLTIDAKGTGTITLGGTSTGAITLTRATTMSAALTYGGVTLSNSVTGTGSMVLSSGPTITLGNATGLPLTTGVTGTLGVTNGGTGQTTASAAFNALSPITSTGDLIIGNGVNSATRLAIGLNTYVLTSNGTTASWAAVPAAALTVGTSTISSGTSGYILYNNAGTLGNLANTGTGINVLNTSPTISGLTTTGTLATANHTITSASANALAVGLNGTTNPAFNVDASTASSATGLNIKSAAAAGGVALSVISSGLNENLSIDAKGTGTITLGGTSTGAITLTRATTMSAALTYGGVTLNNAVTGTGNMVLSASPTLSGTVAGTLTFSGALTLSSALTYGGVTLSNSVTGTGSMVLSAGPTFTGTLASANHTITSASANALAVGPNGTTNPAFNVDASTASSATGLNIKSAAAAGGVALSVISSGLNENLTIDAKGTGTITLGGTSTGAITLTRATTMSAALTYGGVTLSNAVTGTGNMVLSASPTLSGTIGGTLTFSGGLTLSSALTYGGVTLSNSVTGTGSMVLSAGPTFTGTLSSANQTITSSSANALAVGRQGTTSPAFNIDASTASSATGIQIKAAAAGGGVALSAISSGTNENMTIDAKGSGTITIGGTSTGAITLTRATTMSAALTYGGVTLSNSVTGTGSMVLSTSPTFTTPILGTPTSGNLSNCTGFPTATTYTSVLASDILLTQNSPTAIVNTGSIGAVNQVFLIIATFMLNSPNNDFYNMSIAAGATSIAGTTVSVPINNNVSASITVIASLSGATTFTLNATNTGSSSGYVRGGNNADYKPTNIIAVRLS